MRPPLSANFHPSTTRDHLREHLDDLLEDPVQFVQSEEGEVAIARALFSNEAEWPDELPFRKGDSLRVLDERPGLPDGAPSQGWWLCADADGRRGIAPANRLHVMHRFDNGFFQVANPLFSDFLPMLSGQNRRSSDDDPFSFFNHGMDRLFPLSASDRFSQPSPLRRLSSTDNALRGVVRNIPIKIEGQGSSASGLNNEETPQREPSRERGERQSSLPPLNLLGVRRTSSSGRVSPPVPPTRKYFHHVGPSSLLLSSSSNTASSSEDDALTPRAPSTPVQLSRERFSMPDSNIERITQRIRDLAGARQAELLEQPRLSSHRGTSEKISFPSQERTSHSSRVTFPSVERERRESPSPSSSGIGADLTDSSTHSQAEDKEKRSSDVSSISNSSSDPNSSYSDLINDSFDSRLQPPPPTRVVPIQTPHQSRLTSTPSTSVIQTVFDRLRVPTTSVPITVMREDQLREMPSSLHRPTKMSEIPAAEIEERKRVVCQRMVDSLRTIEVAVNRIVQCTKPKLWRQPHILQGNLSALRDSSASIQNALGDFLDVTSRISIDRVHHKCNEFHDQLRPLSESREILGRLRSQLDRAGWTVATLSRTRVDGPTQHDALDHFITKAQTVLYSCDRMSVQLPSDCRRLLQWTQLLIPSSQIVFLSTGTRSSHLSPPFPVDEKRLSSSSTSTITSGDSASSPSSILVTKPSERPSRGRVTFADDPQKTSAENEVTPTPTPSASQPSPIPPPPLTPPVAAQNGHAKKEEVNGKAEETRMNGKAKTEETPILQAESAVMEEDDLESVISDRDSLFQDYALLDEVVPKEPATRPRNSSTPRLNDEDRQLIRFYAPQVDEQSDGLAKAIDDFLASVESHQPPKEFVTKGKLIILAAHKLIYIGDSVSQCVSTASFSVQVRAAADKLCSLLKHCVHATKLAVDEYPRVASIQSMVDSILAVSKAAHELSVLVRDAC